MADVRRSCNASTFQRYIKKGTYYYTFYHHFLYVLLTTGTAGGCNLEEVPTDVVFAEIEKVVKNSQANYALVKASLEDSQRPIYAYLPGTSPAVRRISHLADETTPLPSEEEAALMLEHFHKIMVAETGYVPSSYSASPKRFRVYPNGVLFSDFFYKGEYHHIDKLVESQDVHFGPGELSFFESSIEVTDRKIEMISPRKKIEKDISDEENGSTIIFRSAATLEELARKVLFLDIVPISYLEALRFPVAYPYRYIPNIYRTLVNKGGYSYPFKTVYDFLHVHFAFWKGSINMRNVHMALSSFGSADEAEKLIGFENREIDAFVAENFPIDPIDGNPILIDTDLPVGDGYFEIDRGYFEFLYKEIRKEKIHELTSFDQIKPGKESVANCLGVFTLPKNTLPFVVNAIWSSPAFDDFWKSIIAYFEGTLPKNVLEHKEPPHPQITDGHSDVLEVVGITDNYDRLLLLYKKKDYLICHVLGSNAIAVGSSSPYDYAYSILEGERKRVHLDLVLESWEAANKIVPFLPIGDVFDGPWREMLFFDFEKVYEQVKRNEPWLDRKLELYHASQEALRRLLMAKPKKPALPYSPKNNNMRESSLAIRKRFHDDLLLPDVLAALNYQVYSDWNAIWDDEAFIKPYAPKSHFRTYDMMSLILNGVVNNLSDLEFLWCYSKTFLGNPPLDFVP